MRTHNHFVSCLAAATLLGGCVNTDLGLDPGDSVKAEEGKSDSSVEATFMDFEFDAELLTDNSWGEPRSIIQDQLLYTIGHLNGNRSVGRLDRLTLTNIASTTESTKRRIKYHAKMPVAWGAKTNLPRTYAFTLPVDISYAGQESFTTKYKTKCVDFGAHDVTAGSMWYYYRPAQGGCVIAPTDVIKTTAVTTVSTTNTTGKFPEYHKVWEDNAFKVVSVFGKYEDGATTSSDAGIAAYNEFVTKVRNRLASYPTTTIPSTVPSSPGIAVPDVQFTATLPGGKTIQINALLVDNVSSASSTFYSRYEQLSTRADLIAYNGHAGLGQNVRALAKKGKWVQAQYLILFMNGCDTFAYVDGSLADTRAAFNSDDPTGTKYMDIVTNGMPAFFHSDAEATMALVEGLLKTDAPLTYEMMFRNIDSAQVVLVTGEHDNVYYPGYNPNGGTNNGGAILHETVSANQGETLAFVTKELGAGKYVVKMSHDAQNPGGDADMYVRVGSAPTTSVYDCRPWKDGSIEECAVTLTGTNKIYVNVNGYGGGANHFTLDVTAVGGGTTTPPPAWAGIDESGSAAKSVEKRWQTPALAAGSYKFATTGTGDVDLYVRTGQAPTTATYDCRPYKSGSTESCLVTVPEGAAVHVMVRGYATSSTYRLIATKQ